MFIDNDSAVKSDVMMIYGLSIICVDAHDSPFIFVLESKCDLQLQRRYATTIDRVL
jgi:hypothetical protein